MAKPDVTSYVGLIMRLFQSFEQAAKGRVGRGHPDGFSPVSVVVFFMMMPGRRILHFQAHVCWLRQHPLAVAQLGWGRIPAAHDAGAALPATLSDAASVRGVGGPLWL